MPTDAGESDPARPAREQLLTVHSVEREDAVILVVEGEVDGYTAPRLEVAIADGFRRLEDRTLVIDLSQVRFLGSPGLSALATCARAAKRDRGVDGLRVVVDHRRPVIRPIQLTGLDSVLTLFHNVDDALVG